MKRPLCHLSSRTKDFLLFCWAKAHALYLSLLLSSHLSRFPRGRMRSVQEHFISDKNRQGQRLLLSSYNLITFHWGYERQAELIVRRHSTHWQPLGHITKVRDQTGYQVTAFSSAISIKTLYEIADYFSCFHIGFINSPQPHHDYFLVAHTKVLYLQYPIYPIRYKTLPVTIMQRPLDWQGLKT